MAQRFYVGDLQISSSAFGHLERIPDKHTTNAENVSPPLQWSGAPEGTVQYAIVCHDPDAPRTDGFAHWIAYNIPASTTSLQEGAKPPAEGVGTAGKPHYTGPAPPAGHGIHHYYFWVYALGREFDFEPGLSRRELLDQVADDVLEQARLIGTYSNE